MGYKPSNVIVYAKYAIGDGTSYYFDIAKDGWSVVSYTGTGGTTFRMETKITITETGFTINNSDVGVVNAFYYIAFK